MYLQYDTDTEQALALIDEPKGTCIELTEGELARIRRSELQRVKDNQLIFNESVSLSEEQEREQIEACQYLNATDFYLIRQLETGKPIPNEVLTARAQARKRLTTSLPEFRL